MKVKETLSALMIATSLSGCGEKIPTVQVPSCPGDAQIESDMTGSFFAGRRRFDPTDHRGEWKMTTRGREVNVTFISPNTSLGYSSEGSGILFSDKINYRILTEETVFGSRAHVIASCAE